jgi:hypothetical protein
MEQDYRYLRYRPVVSTVTSGRVVDVGNANLSTASCRGAAYNTARAMAIRMQHKAQRA